MLESVKRVYHKELLNEENEDLTCQLTLKQVETYSQNLRHAYRFSLTFQNKKLKYELESEIYQAVTVLNLAIKRHLKSPYPTIQQTDNEAIFLEELMKDGAMKKKILNLKNFKIKIEFKLDRKIFKLADILNRTEILIKITNIAFWKQYMNEIRRLARLALELLYIYTIVSQYNPKIKYILNIERSQQMYSFGQCTKK
ncbi:hypothetical protein BpHYR1_045676 [Brachionus plicatilis]|uniref:Uncharacterized protein n=1 Tax=Brachionus plicatilis TaxID=10195 RepID=A0A3M7QGN5_BRAPC|nr:hypothetical protein BpHYR1_045676 [Brachionus plicatilis]